MINFLEMILNAALGLITFFMANVSEAVLYLFNFQDNYKGGETGLGNMFSMFNLVFRNVDTVFNLFRLMAAIIVSFIFVYGFIITVAKADTRDESPLMTGLATFFSLFLITFASDVNRFVMGFPGIFYGGVNKLSLVDENGAFADAQEFNKVFISAGVNKHGPALGPGLGTTSIINLGFSVLLASALVLSFYSLVVEAFERYVTLAVLVLFSPFLFMFLAIPRTRKHFMNWVSIMTTQMVLMCMNVIFLKIFVASIKNRAATIQNANGSSMSPIIYMLFLISWLKNGTKIDNMLQYFDFKAVTSGALGTTILAAQGMANKISSGLGRALGFGLSGGGSAQTAMGGLNTLAGGGFGKEARGLVEKGKAPTLTGKMFRAAGDRVAGVKTDKTADGKVAWKNAAGSDYLSQLDKGGKMVADKNGNVARGIFQEANNNTLTPKGRGIIGKIDKNAITGANIGGLNGERSISFGKDGWLTMTPISKGEYDKLNTAQKDMVTRNGNGDLMLMRLSGRDGEKLMNGVKGRGAGAAVKTADAQTRHRSTENATDLSTDKGKGAVDKEFQKKGALNGNMVYKNPNGGDPTIIPVSENSFKKSKVGADNVQHLTGLQGYELRDGKTPATARPSDYIPKDRGTFIRGADGNFYNTGMSVGKGAANMGKFVSAGGTVKKTENANAMQSRAVADAVSGSLITLPDGSSFTAGSLTDRYSMKNGAMVPDAKGNMLKDFSGKGVDLGENLSKLQGASIRHTVPTPDGGHMDTTSSLSSFMAERGTEALADKNITLADGTKIQSDGNTFKDRFSRNDEGNLVPDANGSWIKDRNDNAFDLGNNFEKLNGASVEYEAPASSAPITEKMGFHDFVERAGGIDKFAGEEITTADGETFKAGPETFNNRYSLDPSAKDGRIFDTEGDHVMGLDGNLVNVGKDFSNLEGATVSRDIYEGAGGYTVASDGGIITLPAGMIDFDKNGKVAGWKGGEYGRFEPSADYVSEDSNGNKQLDTFSGSWNLAQNPDARVEAAYNPMSPGEAAARSMAVAAETMNHGKAAFAEDGISSDGVVPFVNDSNTNEYRVATEQEMEDISIPKYAKFEDSNGVFYDQKVPDSPYYGASYNVGGLETDLHGNFDVASLRDMKPVLNEAGAYNIETTSGIEGKITPLLGIVNDSYADSLPKMSIGGQDYVFENKTPSFPMSHIPGAESIPRDRNNMVRLETPEQISAFVEMAGSTLSNTDGINDIYLDPDNDRAFVVQYGGMKMIAGGSTYEKPQDASSSYVDKNGVEKYGIEVDYAYYDDTAGEDQPLMKGSDKHNSELDQRLREDPDYLTNNPHQNKINYANHSFVPGEDDSEDGKGKTKKTPQPKIAQGDFVDLLNERVVKASQKLREKKTGLKRNNMM